MLTHAHTWERVGFVLLAQAQQVRGDAEGDGAADEEGCGGERATQSRGAGAPGQCAFVTHLKQPPCLLACLPLTKNHSPPNSLASVCASICASVRVHVCVQVDEVRAVVEASMKAEIKERE